METRQENFEAHNEILRMARIICQFEKLSTFYRINTMLTAMVLRPGFEPGSAAFPLRKDERPLYLTGLYYRSGVARIVFVLICAIKL